MTYVIQGIQHVGIAVSDMDKSLKLYRKLFGLESQGMLLMAEDRTGKLVPIEGASEPGSVVS